MGSAGEVQTLRGVDAINAFKVSRVLASGECFVTGKAVIIARKLGLVPSRLLYQGPINGLPGFVTVEPGEVLQTTARGSRTGGSPQSTWSATPRNRRGMRARFQPMEDDLHKRHFADGSRSVEKS